VFYVFAVRGVTNLAGTGTHIFRFNIHVDLLYHECIILGRMKIENRVKGITIEITTDELKELNTLSTYLDWRNSKTGNVADKLLDTLDKFLSNTKG